MGGLGGMQGGLGTSAALAGWLVWAASSVAAEGLNLGEGGATRPVEIQADSGIEWQQSAQLYIARGNAVATRGTTEVHADTLIAHYRPAKGAGQGGATEIYRLDAEGHVLIKGPTQTVVGDHAVYDVDQALVVVTGKGLKMTTATDTVTARDSLEWYDQKQVGVARGDAVAIRRDKTIKADILTAYTVKGKEPAKPTDKAGQHPAPPVKPMAPAKPIPAKAPSKPGAPDTPAEGSTISRVDAQGHVIVIGAADTGRGDYGVYNAETGIATLVGNVVLTRDKDVVRGQYAVMDLNNNVSRLLPASSLPGAPPQRVQGLFERQSQPAGAARSSAAGTPASAPPASPSEATPR
ncbi:MAG: hypothetical protein JO038_10155 [Alphaproteobacteria bacterium]|nr:hypothetical protein [Alphaproteobacteria bacterium]